MDELRLQQELAELRALPLAFWIILAIVLMIQSTWLFLDARKHGRYPWFWGIWGLLSVPGPFVLYLLIYRVNWTKKND